MPRSRHNGGSPRNKDRERDSSASGGSNRTRASAPSGGGSKAKAKPKKNPAGYGKKGFKPLAKEKRGNEKAVARRQPNYSGKKDQTGKSTTRGEVRKKTAARVKEKNPSMKGKKLQTRINKQTTAGVQRRRDRGMKVEKKKK